MLLQRVLTAAVALPLLTAAVLFGPALLLVILFGLLGLAAWREYGRITGSPPHWLWGLGLLGGEAFLVLMSRHQAGPAAGTLMAGFALLAGASIFQFSSRPTVIGELERTLLGLWLVFIPLGTMVGVVLSPDRGRMLLLFLLAVVFAGDTGAYFTGRALGRKKLCPKISPAKTWAGLWGGLVAGGLVGLAAGLLDGRPAAVYGGAALGLVLAVLGAAGDLMISMVKRTYQVKDAGRVFPGHGGVLDRLDSFILSGPALYAAWRIWGL